MSKTNHWAVPGFTCLAMLALSACSGGGSGMGGTPSGGSGGGGGGGPIDPPVVDFVVPNAYATYGSATPDKLDNLVVFGDSYSDPLDPKRSCANPANKPCLKPADTWSRLLVADAAPGAELHNYAKGKASARDTNVYDGGDNTLKTQVDRAATDPGLTMTENSLGIIYMGYNDINKLGHSNGELAVAADDYEEQLDRLLVLADPTGKQRMFVTLVHDWGATPAEIAATASRTDCGTPEECNFKRLRTQYFNDLVAQMANERDNVVAVDMFTVFDRIAADPARYGFSNVTTADKAKSDDATDAALYFDDRHFGARGQAIIAEVFNHYLTRGWDWSNQFAAGAAATQKLNDDIDNGRLLSLAALAPEQRLGLNSFVVGDTAFTAAAAGTGARSSFEAMRGTADRNTGFGLNYGIDEKTSMGIVMSNYHDESESSSGVRSTNLDYESNAVSFYFDTELSGLQLRTVASFSNDEHGRREHDGLVDAGSSATFGGRTTALSQTISRPIQAAGGWFTPWLNLSHTVQQLDDYTISNPYLSDTTYEGHSVSETFATLGLSAASAPISLGGQSRLTLDGRVSYSQSLALDDYRVSIREKALGYAEEQVIERGDEGIFALRLGADLALDPQLSLSAGYEVSKQSDAEAEQNVSVRMNYRF